MSIQSFLFSVVDMDNPMFYDTNYILWGNLVSKSNHVLICDLYSVYMFIIYQNAVYIKAQR